VVAFEEAFNIDWDAARTQCQSVAFTNGGELISIHSYEEHKLIFDFAYARFNTDPLEMWIGFKEMTPGTFASWAWSDGSPRDYENWEGGEPSSSTQNCGRYRGSGGVATWWDWYCSGTNQNKIKAYVCYVDAVTECNSNPSDCFCYDGIGYTGIGCQTPICFDVPADDPNTCSGHGTCADKNLCTCNGGYFGSNCNQPCPKGYFSNTGDSSCSPCNAGFWCEEASNDAQQHSCLPGEYSTSGSAVCGSCYAGYRCDSESSSPTQNSCTAGQWSPSNSSVCLDCNAGYYCTNNSPSPQQNKCGAGKWSPAGSDQCYDCDAGYVCSSGSSSANQTACAPGKYSTVGSSVCTNCQAGHWCGSASTSPTMNQCAPGSWSSGGSASCLPCASGFYCPVSGSTTATPNQCISGHYCPEGTSTPEPCWGGFICLSGSSQPNLIPCPAGYWSNNGSSACTPCDAGYYCPNEASNNAQDKICDAGTWSFAGSVSCSPCSAGHYCPAGSVTSTAVPCPAGTYSGAAAAQCTNATAGSYVPTPGSTVTQKCQPGTYSDEGADKCAPCPGGTYSFTGASQCTPCEQGTYSGGGRGYCSSCPAGHYCLEETTVPTLCPNGTFSVPLSESASDCQNCTASYYCISPSNTPQQYAAPAGTFTLEGAFEPRSCPENFYCIGASPPLQCANGEYSIGGSSSCDPCPSGYYCRAGFEPTLCDPGRYSTGGATQCVPCSAGTYTSATGSSSCANCTRGYACVAGSNSATQQVCQPGYWSWDGYGACEECSPGYACPSTASSTSQEVACTPGKFSSGGFSVCMNCTAGYWCGARSPSAMQNACPDGWWSLGGSSSSSQCTIPVCGGVPANDPLTCSNHGDCLNPNDCDCDDGYGGDTCQFPFCFGKNSSFACSHPAGVCTAPDICTCSSGYLGTECEIPTCFDVASTDNATCSGRGQCVELDDCECTSGTGYTGSNCNVPICWNIRADNSSVCSGHGECNAPEQCSCQPLFLLSDCSLPVCYGHNATDDMVCSAHGECELANQCACFTDYYGSECNEFNCFGVTMSSSSVCGGHGTCVQPNSCNCTTPHLYSGILCDQPVCFGFAADSALVCSNGQGICTLPDKCVCQPGFDGIQCETELENQPVSVLRMPEFIGDCDSLELDGTLSYAVTPGAIKFYWRCESGSDCDYINYWIKQNSDPTKSVQMLDGTMLSSGVLYTFSHYVASAQGVSGKKSFKSVERVSQTTPQVVVRGASSLTIFRDEPLNLDADVSLQMCSSQTSSQAATLLESATHAWTQISGPSLGSLLVNSQRGTVLSMSALSLPAVAATYQFRLSTTLASGVSSWANVYVSVKRRGLIAQIAGGDRTVSQAKDFILNAQNSFDPEKEATSSSYVWSCDKCPGSLSIPLWSEVTIPANSLSPGQYVFTVTYSKGARSSQHSVIITVVASTVAPTITLTYPSIINKNERLVISAHVADANVNEGSVQTYWTVTSGNLELDDTLFVDRKRSKTRTELALKENVLQEGEIYEFSFRVVTNDDIASSTAKIAVNSPPQYGEVTISPSSGYMMHSTFSAVSQGWYDINLPLLYSFELIYPSGATTLMQSYSKKNSVNFLSTEDGAMTLRCRIKDSLGGIAVHDTQFSVLNSNMYSVSTSDALNSATEIIGNLSSSAVGFEEKISRLKTSMQYMGSYSAECIRKGCDTSFTASVAALQKESMDNIQQLVNQHQSSSEGDLSLHIIDALRDATMVPQVTAQLPSLIEQASQILNETMCTPSFVDGVTHQKLISSLSNTLDAVLLSHDASLIATVQKRAQTALRCMSRNVYQQQINGEGATTLQSEHYSLIVFKDVVRLLQEESSQTWFGVSGEDDVRVRVSSSLLSGYTDTLDESVVLTVTRFAENLFSGGSTMMSPVVDVSFFEASNDAEISTKVSEAHAVFIPSSKQISSNKVIVCKYWDTDSNAWSTSGVSWDGGSGTCLTYHTTPFALFAEDPDKGASNGMGNWLYIVIGAVTGGSTLVVVVLCVCTFCLCLLLSGAGCCICVRLLTIKKEPDTDNWDTSTSNQEDWKSKLTMGWQPQF